MKDTSLTLVKDILKSLDSYPGEWQLNSNISNISLCKNGKNLFESFLDRYYYLALNVIFKDEELIRSFKYGLCSLPGDGYRRLYFSKRVFLRNVIPNIDDVLNCSGEVAYKSIKKALRIKKDMYRDVVLNGKKSDYYDDVINEYNKYNLKISFDKYLVISRKKYTRLLNGYNALLDFFNKPIDLNKFVACFDPDQLYLFVCYTLLEMNKKYLDLYSRLDFTIKYVDEYVKYVKDVRKSCSFYNSHIMLNSDKMIIYTIDDLIKDYDDILKRIAK